MKQFSNWNKVSLNLLYLAINHNIFMIQEGTTLDHDFYVDVGKQCRTENAYAGH